MGRIKIVLVTALFLNNLVHAVGVKATAYALHGVTASGKRTSAGMIAVSRDLLRRYPLGTKVILRCSKGNSALYTVLDTMGQSSRRAVDVWMPHYSAAKSWGVKSCQLSTY